MMENKIFLVSSRGYFEEVVESAFVDRHLQARDSVKSYLVGLLEQYLDARNLYEEKDPTLAEMYLLAQQSAPTEKLALLKKLAERSLYISGFFGDSLSRKVVDIDYYANIGGAAYAGLAEVVREDLAAQVFRTCSERFLDFVEVLTYISQQSMVQSDQNILRLYDRYLRTGSDIAKDKLVEMGILTLPADQIKLAKQD